jgi:hypothetical protein
MGGGKICLNLCVLMDYRATNRNNLGLTLQSYRVNSLMIRPFKKSGLMAPFSAPDQPGTGTPLEGEMGDGHPMAARARMSIATPAAVPAGQTKTLGKL